MSSKLDDLEHEIDSAMAEGDRACAALKGQLQRAQALVREAKTALEDAHGASAERRSFAAPADDAR